MPSGMPWGLALMSGVNTYLPLLLLSLVARYTDAVTLGPAFSFLISDEAVLLLAGLALAEIVVEKFPVLDNAWDAVHTLVRPAAGALVAGATATPSSETASPLAMILGALLAGGAHAVKSSARLVSTTKTLGTANPFLSFADDAAAASGTLLSIYVPWIMLGVVTLFAAVSVLLGPRLARATVFNLTILLAWARWLFGRATGSPPPQDLRESLMEVPPERLKLLAARLEPGEKLLGAIPGWRRSRGARKATLFITEKRLVLAEHRWLRAPRVEPVAISDVSLARHRTLGLYSRLEWLTRANELHSLTLRRTHGGLGELAAREISRLAENSAGTPEGEAEGVGIRK